MRKIVLASTSPRRKELLTKTGLEFEVCAGDYKEDMTLLLPPMELASFLSKGKAESVASRYEDALIISADTFIYFDGHVLGKPHTLKRAREMLKLLSGNEHSIFTGFTIMDTKNKKTISKTIESKVKFKVLSNLEIDGYIKTGESLDRAGAYDFRATKSTFVENVTGDQDNIIGLPVANLVKTLELFGVKV
jgi:septum formation protein